MKYEVNVKHFTWNDLVCQIYYQKKKELLDWIWTIFVYDMNPQQTTAQGQ